MPTHRPPLESVDGCLGYLTSFAPFRSDEHVSVSDVTFLECTRPLVSPLVGRFSLPSHPFLLCLFALNLTIAQNDELQSTFIAILKHGSPETHHQHSPPTFFTRPITHFWIT
jgi:hypothetical protein